MSYIFPFVEVDVFVGVDWNKNINICFSFDVVDAINDVYIGVFPLFGILITDEVGCMSLNYMSFDLDRYNSIVYGLYLKGWFYINIFLLLAVSGVGKESTLLLYVTIFILSQA